MAQFSFGSNVGTTTSAPTGFTFGTPKSTAPQINVAPVAPTVQNPGLSLGTSTLGTSTLGGGLSFGTPAKTTGVAFGATPIAAPTLPFGATSTAPNLSFGATPVASVSSFGTTSTAPTLSFIPSSAPSLLFAGTTTSTAPVLSFAPPASSTGLSLGTTPNFGLGTATSTPSLFNTPATTSTAFGGLNFGISTPSTGFSLGLPTSSTAPTLNFGLGGSLTSTTPTLNFKASVAPTTNTTLNFGFNLPGKTQATTNLTPSTITTPAIGLGGVDSSQSKIGEVTTGRPDAIAAKENPVPNEIIQLIENFKQFVKDQKAHSSDVSRGSARPFLKIGEDIDLLNSILSDVGNNLQRNQQQADKLKHDSAKCLHNAEMAQRTNDTPPGLQFENTAPLRYFIDLVNQFEQDLQALRLQIDITDKHFQSLHEQRFLSSQELAAGMRKLHETFVALAGRLHAVHTQVESQKEQYLNLRKYILKDPTNIFTKADSERAGDINNAIQGLVYNKTVSGPTPFSSFRTPFGTNPTVAQDITSKPPPSYTINTRPRGFETGSSNLFGSTAPQENTLFGGTSILSQTQDTSAFQLQSPPVGNKRGKR